MLGDLKMSGFDFLCIQTCYQNFQVHLTFFLKYLTCGYRLMLHLLTCCLVSRKNAQLHWKRQIFPFEYFVVEALTGHI